MKIIKVEKNENILKIVVDSNEETVFSLIKAYFIKNKDVDIVGTFKDHYLIDKTEFVLKIKKGDPIKVFKKVLAEVKKEIKSMKVK
jgi:DNA-directed RNA polymerase subunit L